jgi:hypothetical protein
MTSPSDPQHSTVEIIAALTQDALAFLNAAVPRLLALATAQTGQPASPSKAAAKPAPARKTKPKGSSVAPYPPLTKRAAFSPKEKGEEETLPMPMAFG